MNVKSDLQIAKEATPLPIFDIAEAAGIPKDCVIPYGMTKAKLSLSSQNSQKGKLILVTAINPTPAGEGKTTVSIGLADGMQAIGKKTMLALREPSLGPVFGMKGGAAGGGYSQVIPMEEINLHFTGDLHAITSANNLLCAMVDNHLQQGNVLGIDPRRVVIKRCMDMNDRQLRFLVSGIGGTVNGVPRETGFDITAASEVMAVFCLATDLADLKSRLGRIVVAYTFDGTPVLASQIGAPDAMAILLRDAMQPNLVQTLTHTPALMHGGPFANIAHGCNSVIATKTALSLADYVVTEAGFGADLGAEKFLDIKCRQTGLWPDATVLVATIRALKSHGGVKKADLSLPDPQAVERGLPNLIRHIKNLRGEYHLPVIVAINQFLSDSAEEIAVVQKACSEHGVEAILADVWGKGGEGARELAAAVCRLADSSVTSPAHPYALEASIPEKIQAVAQKIYGAKNVVFAVKAEKQIRELTAQGYGNLPVCIAKTQYSLSDDASLIGCPEGFEFHVRELHLSAGAGFIVALSGSIMTMPGLPRVPAAQNMSLSDSGEIDGLF